MAKRSVKRSQEDLIVDHLTALTNAEIKRFFRQHRVTGGSAKLKHELRAIARKSIDDNSILSGRTSSFGLAFKKLSILCSLRCFLTEDSSRHSFGAEGVL